MGEYKLNVVPFKNDWKEKAGALRFKMRNDYLFRAFLQCDNESLKALIASLLYVDVSEITSAEITNPIVLGASADDKEIIRERMRNREEGEQLWRSMEKELEEYKKQADEDQKTIRELKAKLAALEK